MSARLPGPLVVATIAIALVSGACSGKPPENDADYVAQIGASRIEKDAEFRKNPDPVPDNRKA
jgi:hypothetical protein